MNSREESDRRAPALIFAAALALFAWLVWRFRFLTDDAFISFRYAKNFALGYGLVFNPGEAPPVEGYTDFLWVVLVSLFEKFGLDVAIWSRAVSAATGLVLFLWVGRVACKRFSGTPLVCGLVGAFLGCLPPLAVWSTGGLGTMPFALAVFAAFERLLAEPREPRWKQAGLWAASLVLLRADGFVWVGLLCCAGLTVWFTSRRPALLRAIARVALVSGIVLAVFVAWRLYYYGDYVPNTARIKVGLSTMTLVRGVKYSLSFLVVFPSCLVALALAIPGLWRPGKELPRAAVVVVAGTFAYSALVGGDYLTMGRFLVPSFPFLALLFGFGLGTIGGRRARAPLLQCTVAGLSCVASLLPAFDVHVAPLALREALHFRYGKPPTYRTEYKEWLGTTRVNGRLRDLGRALQLHTRPGDSIILRAVGAVGYYSNLHIYDQWGLTSREVALSPAARRIRSSAGHDVEVPPQFFLSHKPTYLFADIAGASEVGKAPPELEPKVAIDLYPLAQEAGFAEGSVLRLFRIVYAP